MSSGRSPTLKRMEKQHSDPIVVFMTASSSEEAMRIADALVNQRLAACVQILPEMQSIYLWKGEVQAHKEVLLLAKTTRLNFAKLEKEVRAVHSYETPEILAVPVAECSEGYLKWLTSSCEGS